MRGWTGSRLALTLAAGAMLAGSGCLRRADYVPPPAPVPIAAERRAIVSAPTKPLGTTDLVRLALEQNPDFRAAGTRVSVARARLAEAEARFWPRLSADVSYLQGDAPSAFLFKRIDAHALPPNTDFNNPGAFTNFEGGLGLRWNLLDGGRDVLGRWAADAGVSGEMADYAAARNRLVATTITTYLEARAASALLSADDASVRTVEAQVAETRANVDAGMALRSDLLSLEVRLAEAHERRLGTDVARRLTLTALRELVGLPPGTPIELADTTYDGARLPATPVDGLAEAYRRRPEAQAARAAVERGKIDVAAAERAYLPRLDLQARLYADDAEGRLEPGDPNWTVAVALSIDLFDGGARAAAIRRARAVLDGLTEADRARLLEIARDVDDAYLRLDEARARLAVASPAAAAAEETLRLVGEQYRGGAATVTRYLESEGDQTRARTARIRAQLDVERAAVDVARATGIEAGGE